jgi:arginyl-tRNA--protein-N-Asp/Glu arginylyltransferase
MPSGDEPPWQQRLLALLDAGALPPGETHPCSYFPDRVARSRAFAAEELPGEIYQGLMDRGFRRSGAVFYAMACPGCLACVPLRVPVAGFQPSRSQRRARQRNRDVRLQVAAPELSAAKYAMYQRYVDFQHPGRGGANPYEQFRNWLYDPVVPTLEATYWLGDQLVAATILDVTPQAVSSVYHYFEPEEAKRSLGVYSVLAEIEWTANSGRPYYYLGFWIEGSPTMHYKRRYQPNELLQAGRWQPQAPDKV